jgi:hypothetical protein
MLNLQLGIRYILLLVLQLCDTVPDFPLQTSSTTYNVGGARV